ncbi:PQ-loop repeat-containing protein [Candidatus Woesearchaeota archaeon]|nr:PQ-loop repeat-containing protein [Candidatus Woesearchaeota archaeon]
MIEDIIGYIAGIVIIISWIPQVVKSYRTKSVNDLSSMMIVLIITGTILWIIYALLVKDKPVLAVNAVLAILISYLLYLKIKYDK